MITAERSRFLSEADCHNIVDRLARFARGGGYTGASIASVWTGNIRWARNQISTTGESQNNFITVVRNIRGASDSVIINDTTDAALVAAARRAERLAAVNAERPNSDLIARLPLEPASQPMLFSEATYQLDASHRATIAIALMQQARTLGVSSAGYIEVTAASLAQLDTLGRVRYFAYTQAQYSVTVRDPRASASGWGGVDWYDWRKIDAAALTARALEKCLRSRNPVAIEPGRYTTILEPQAVSDFVGPLIHGSIVASNAPISRGMNEGGSSPPGPFVKSTPTPAAPGYSRLGERVVDERITITADPMDPDAGFAPFSFDVSGGSPDPFAVAVYHPVTWIEHGVLTNLAYPRFRGIDGPGRDLDLGMPNSGAYRMSGGKTTIDEMIATTQRGLLVTRFDHVLLLNLTSQMYRGYTRDGLWFIENGKISKPAKNLAFTESILMALNNVEQLGEPQRVFHPNRLALYGIVPAPAVVPPLKIRDFSFTALSDAV